MKMLFAVSAVALLATAALARPLPREAALKVMHERHEGMESIGKANKVLRRELTADAPDIGAVRAAAATIAGLSAKASKWFVDGTGPDVGKTGAKPEIWKQPADFAARLRDFQGAAKALQLAAARGDGAGAKAGYANLGKTCKACHDSYRSEMHH